MHCLFYIDSSSIIHIGLQEVIVSHHHYDHFRGVESILKEFGPIKVSKFIVPEDLSVSRSYVLSPIVDGQQFETEGATLKAVHTPGHADDHLVFVLHEVVPSLFFQVLYS